MKKLIVLLLLSFVVCSNAFASDTLSSASTDGTALTLGGTFVDKITTSDAHIIYETFEDGTFDPLFTFPNGQLSWSLSQNGVNRTGSNYCANRNGKVYNEQLNIIPADKEYFYTSFQIYFSSTNTVDGANNKVYRHGDNAVDHSGYTNCVWTIEGASQEDWDDPDTVSAIVIEAGTSGTSVGYNAPPVSEFLDQWAFIEIFEALPVNGSSDNYFKIYINGQLEDSITDKFWEDEGFTRSPYLALCGLTNASYPIVDGYWLDDITFDYTAQHVVLTNASTWATSTIFEPQEIDTWSTSEISCDIRYGALNQESNIYAYTFNVDNDPSNSGDGVLLTTDEGANCSSIKSVAIEENVTIK